MSERINLLHTLPRARRNVEARVVDKDAATVMVSKWFGREYFDGDRKYGYGGYRYDGRWLPVARTICDHYHLRTSDVYGGGARVLDVGCAKGFLVRDLCEVGLDAYGIDFSPYAVREAAHPDVVGRLHLGTATYLPFPDDSFDLVVSINTLHNLDRARVVTALREIARVSRGPAFVQVDSYLTPEDKARFEDWVLTAEFHGYPDEWLAVFAEAGYDGDYDWTIV